MQRSLRLDLDSWSRWHAVAMLAAGTASAIARSTWVLGVVAAGSFAWLLALARGRTTESGAFGPGNAVTLLRLAGVIALPAVPARFLAAAVLGIVALDGLDGLVARRTGTASEFGAHFDMESDGVFVAVTTLEAFTRGRLGTWVLVAGALRYAYVSALWAFPSDRGEEPRSWFGRSAFLVLMLCLATSWSSEAPWATAIGAFGCAVVTISFTRSFLHSYGPR
jgi:phosphatidylglycerophosphate synthase